MSLLTDKNKTTGSESVSLACCSRNHQFTRMELEALDDEALAVQSGAGSKYAFTLLIRRYQDPIIHYLFHLIKNHSEAEDVAQESFVKAYHSIQRFDPKYRFSTWIHTIAKRTAFNHNRSRKLTVEIPENLEFDGQNPSEAFESLEDGIFLWKIVARLKPNQAEVIFLHYRQSFSVKEIAQIMGTSAINIKVLLFRGRAALKKLLDHDNKTNGEHRL